MKVGEYRTISDTASSAEGAGRVYRGNIFRNIAVMDAHKTEEIIFEER